jgi:hypothetical protein
MHQHKTEKIPITTDYGKYGQTFVDLNSKLSVLYHTTERGIGQSDFSFQWESHLSAVHSKRMI